MRTDYKRYLPWLINYLFKKKKIRLERKFRTGVSAFYYAEILNSFYYNVVFTRQNSKFVVNTINFFGRPLVLRMFRIYILGFTDKYYRKLLKRVLYRIPGVFMLLQFFTYYTHMLYKRTVFDVVSSLIFRKKVQYLLYDHIVLKYREEYWLKYRLMIENKRASRFVKIHPDTWRKLVHYIYTDNVRYDTNTFLHDLWWEYQVLESEKGFEYKPTGYLTDPPGEKDRLIIRQNRYDHIYFHDFGFFSFDLLRRPIDYGMRGEIYPEFFGLALYDMSVAYKNFGLLIEYFRRLFFIDGLADRMFVRSRWSTMFRWVNYKNIVFSTEEREGTILARFDSLRKKIKGLRSTIRKTEKVWFFFKLPPKNRFFNLAVKHRTFLVYHSYVQNPIARYLPISIFKKFSTFSEYSIKLLRSALGLVAGYSQRHYYHMVTPSPWPLMVSIFTFNMLLLAVLYMHGFIDFYFVFLNIGLTGFVMLVWGRDVIREGTFEGMHTSQVKANLRQGVMMFILTEVMFFFGFFWAFFHSALAPAVQLGCIWPPVGIAALDAFKLPFLNTCLLLLSGVYITLCHQYLLKGFFIFTRLYFFYTLLMGIVFTIIQGYEYSVAQFSIADSAYGSTFFLLTGFHGFHVIVGTVLIIICAIRALQGHFTQTRHVGFEAAAWYWHFVDVVWIGLFFSLYVWGNI